MLFRKLSLYLLCILSIFLSSCSYSMYPTAITQETNLTEKESVILIGLHGTNHVNYIQLCHGSIPCLNFKIPPTTNDIIALPIPVGLKNVELNSFTVEEEPAGYGYGLGYSTVPHGYKTVKDIPIKVIERGVYFMGMLNTDNSKLTLPNDSVLKVAKSKFGRKMGNYQTLNFNWDKL